MKVIIMILLAMVAMTHVQGWKGASNVPVVHATWSQNDINHKLNPWIPRWFSAVSVPDGSTIGQILVASGTVPGQAPVYILVPGKIPNYRGELPPPADLNTVPDVGSSLLVLPESEGSSSEE